MRTLLLVIVLALGACSGPVKLIPIPKPVAKCVLQPGNYLMKTFLKSYSAACSIKPPQMPDKILPFSGQECGIFGVPFRGGFLIVKFFPQTIIGKLIVSDGKCEVEYGLVGNLVK